MKKTLLAGALLGCTLTAHAAGFDPSPDTASAESANPLDTNTLDPVIVTATRTTITEDEALSSVTVITRADIDRLQPVSVIDLLQGLPGITFVQSGGIGQQSSLFMRGTNSSHTLVLIDGVRIVSITAGLAAFEQIPVEQIERIEIVRGPRSSLYGADAIGGVIQIFTRHGQRDGDSLSSNPLPSLSVTTGSRGFLRGQAGLAGGDTHAWYNLSLGGEYTSGIPACRLGAAAAGAGCFVDDPRSDAYRNWNGAANGGYRWDNGTELALTWLRSKNEVELAGSPNGGNQAVTAQEVAGARLSFSPLELWKVTLNAGQSRDNRQNYFSGTYLGEYIPREATGYQDSRRNQASWQNDIALADNQLLTVGADYQQEHISSDTGYLDSTRGDAGSYAQYQGTFGRNQLQLAARHDHNSQFGNHDTGAVAWGYAFDHDLRLSASYGSAFHAPTFNDLYNPPFGGVPSANPNLKPEASRSAELGLTQKSDSWNWAVNAYQTKIDRLITPDANYFPLNISRARIRGIEGQLGFDLDGWRVQNYLTLLQPKNDGGGANDGNLLPRRPERTARIDMDRNFGRFSLGGSFNANGKRYDDPANRYRLGGYSTADLRAGYAFARDWRVEARLANAFDRRYETAYYYNQPGRSWYLTMRYSPATH